jgi:proteasome accessory factor A
MKMLFGLENEYTAFDIDDRTWLPDLNRLPKNFGKLVLGSFNNNGNVFGRGLRNAVWFLNGSKIYNDLGHVEYASPECETLEDFIVQERVGDRLVFMIFGKEAASDNIFIMKRSTDTRPDKKHEQGGREESTWGSHENFMILDWLWRDLNDPSKETPARLVLEAHLATRPVYTGAGQIRFLDEEGKVPIFLLSPRAQYLFYRVSVNSTNARPFINNREGNTASNDIIRGDYARNYRRLHILAGDMNRSSWSIYLKMGTTILILWYLTMRSRSSEVENLIEHINLNVDPTQFIKQLSRVFLPDVSMKCYEHALNIQRFLLKVMKSNLSALEDHFPEAPKVVALWELALEEVENPFLPVSHDKLDWTIQKSVFEEEIGLPVRDLCRLPLKKSDLDVLESLALSYFRINSDDLFSRGVAEGWINDLVDEAALDRALTTPPQGRAERRVKIIKYVIESSLLPFVSSFDWSAIYFTRDSGGNLFINENYDVIIDSTPFEELKLKVDRIAKKLKR